MVSLFRRALQTQHEARLKEAFSEAKNLPSENAIGRRLLTELNGIEQTIKREALSRKAHGVCVVCVYDLHLG